MLTGKQAHAVPATRGLAVMLLSLALASTAAAAEVEGERHSMGMPFRVRALAADSAVAVAAVEKAMNEVDRLERVMSSLRPDSELAHLNRSATRGWTALSADLFAVVSASLAAAKETRGAFDPTIEPLVKAWDLRGEGREPDARELARVRDVVGWSRVLLDPISRTVRFDKPGVSLDLGGIAKGYALDRAAEAMRQAGVSDAWMDLGGEVLAMGSERQDGWTLELASPLDHARAAVRLRLRGQSASTSGQGGRGIEVEGRHYGHVLNPRTQLPVDARATVAVVGRSAAWTDALSTALRVMGRPEARAFALAHPDLGVLWMEPGPGRVRAWCWNLAGVAAAPGMRVEWMEGPPRGPQAPAPE